MSAYKLFLVFAMVATMYAALKPPHAVPKTADRPKVTRIETWSHNLLYFLVQWIWILPALLDLSAECTTLNKLAPSSLSASCEKASYIPHTQTEYLLAGMGVMLAGVSIRKWCYRTMGRMFTFEFAIQKNHTLITDGPYAWVRHPSYTGGIVLLSGCCIAYGPWAWTVEKTSRLEWISIGLSTLWIVFSLLAVGVMIGRCKVEDEGLRKKFGVQWDRWAEKARWKLVPGLY